MKIAKGQVWKELDMRAKGRTVTVESVKGAYVTVISSKGRKSRIMRKSFHNDPTRLAGFACIQETT